MAFSDQKGREYRVGAGGVLVRPPRVWVQRSGSALDHPLGGGQRSSDLRGPLTAWPSGAPAARLRLKRVPSRKPSAGNATAAWTTWTARARSVFPGRRSSAGFVVGTGEAGRGPADGRRRHRGRLAMVRGAAARLGERRVCDGAQREPRSDRRTIPRCFPSCIATPGVVSNLAVLSIRRLLPDRRRREDHRRLHAREARAASVAAPHAMANQPVERTGPACRGPLTGGRSGHITTLAGNAGARTSHGLVTIGDPATCFRSTWTS